MNSGPKPLSALEEGVKPFLGFIAFAGIGAPSHQDGIRLEVIAVVGSFFIADPLSLGFGTLVVFSRIVELAVTAAMQVSVAARTRITRSNAL